MNAYQFVKEHGLKKAKSDVDVHFDYTHITNDAKMWVNEFRCDANIRKQVPSMLRISDVRQAIADYELVNVHGFERSKQILKDAPADVECFSWALGNSGIRDKTVILADLKTAIERIEQGLK